MTNSPVARAMSDSFTSSHLWAFWKISGSCDCTHLYFQSGSLTLVDAACVARSERSSIPIFTPETHGPCVWQALNSAVARWSI